MMLLGFLVGISVTLGGGLRAEESQVQVDSPGLAAFKKHVYPILRAHCATCHSGSGALSVEHSSEDPAVAYDIALNLADFQSPEKSYFVQKAAQKHWNQHIKKLSPQPTAEEAMQLGAPSEELEAAIRAWWLEGQNLEPLGFVTISDPWVLLGQGPDAASLKVTEQWQRVAWNVKLENDIQLRFKAQVKLYTAGNEETDPSIAISHLHVSHNSLSPVALKGIGFLVNGLIHPLEDDAERVDVVLPPTTTSAFTLPVTLSPEWIVLVTPRDPQGEITLTLGIRDCVIANEGHSPEDSPAMRFFQERVAPIFLSECAPCHLGDMQAQLRAWVTPGIPEQSRLLSRFKRDSAGMRLVPHVLTEDDLRLLEEWILKLKE